MRSETEGEVTIFFPVEDDLVGPLELASVQVGRVSVDEESITSAQLLPSKNDIPRHRARPRAGDRRVAQELLGCRRVQLRVIDELLANLGMCGQIAQRHSGDARRRVQ